MVWRRRVALRDAQGANVALGEVGTQFGTEGKMERREIRLRRTSRAKLFATAGRRMVQDGEVAMKCFMLRREL